MCIGLPMQLTEVGDGYAVCKGMGMTRNVDTLLVGNQPIGTWVLVFLESAREVLCEEDALKITDAIQAVDLVMSSSGQLSTDALENQTIDALFADLIDREPQKPASLIAFEESQKKQNGE